MTTRADPHPDLDQWIAYHGGELSAGDEDRLRSHLVRCGDCVALVLDVESFTEPCEEDRAAVSELEMAAAWRAMKAALAQDEEQAPVAAPATAIKERRAVRWLDRRVPIPMALAASIMVGFLGLSFWVAEHQAAARLRGLVAAQSSPISNLVIRDLEPNMVTRSGSSPSPTMLRRDKFYALVMLPSKPFERYRVEVVDAAGQSVWSDSGLLPDPDLGTLKLGLPPGSLEAGDYRVRLYGNDQEIPLDDYLPIEVLP